jgi:hypothetical protein
MGERWNLGAIPGTSAYRVIWNDTGDIGRGISDVLLCEIWVAGARGTGFDVENEFITALMQEPVAQVS